MSDRGARPVEWLRGVALSLERLAAQGVAGGALRGAADELRAGFPDDLEPHVRNAIEGALIVLERLFRDAATAGAPPLDTWSRSAAEGAVRGAVEEIRRLIPELRPTTQEVMARIQLWLERSAAESTARAQEIRVPGDRARIAAAGAVAGGVEELAAMLPKIAGPANALAEQVGRGVVRGAGEELARQLREAGRSRTVRRALAFGAAFVALLVVARR